MRPHFSLFFFLVIVANPALSQGLQPLRSADPPVLQSVRPPASQPPTAPAGSAQPAPDTLAPAPPSFQEGAWIYQPQEEDGRRTCVLAARAQDGTFLVLRTIQNYGPDLTLVNPAWRLQGERLRIRVSIGSVSKDLPAFIPAPQQLRADLVADAEVFADLLEAAETLVNPPVQAVAPGQRPLTFSSDGLRAAAARFGDCIETLHGRPAAPASQAPPTPRR